jgi:hypothetical protein
MYERADDKEGLGCIAWTGVCLIALVVAIAMTCCGCEDDGDTTIIYEGDDIIMSTNSPGIAIKDNDGSVTVTQITSADSPTPTIAISGNTGRVYVATQPQELPPEPAP